MQQVAEVAFMFTMEEALTGPEAEISERSARHLAGHVRPFHGTATPGPVHPPRRSGSRPAPSSVTVLVEFDNLAQAIATHDSPGYQAALAVLGNAAERDMRIIEGD